MKAQKDTNVIYYWERGTSPMFYDVEKLNAVLRKYIKKSFVLENRIKTVEPDKSEKYVLILCVKGLYIEGKKMLHISTLKGICPCYPVFESEILQ